MDAVEKLSAWIYPASEPAYQGKNIRAQALCIGDNLFMIFNNLDEYGAGDPEFVSGNGGVYPNMKNISLGLNITF
jgi:hypothetical protein